MTAFRPGASPPPVLTAILRTRVFLHPGTFLEGAANVAEDRPSGQARTCVGSPNGLAFFADPVGIHSQPSYSLSSATRMIVDSPTDLTLDESGETPPMAGAPVVQALLPRTAPRVDGFDLAGGTAVEPALPGTTVWARFSLADGRTVLGALQVQSAHPPPPLALAVTRAFLIERAQRLNSSAEVLAKVNDAVASAALEGPSQTTACGLLVVGGDTVEWACAGQLSGGVLRRHGSFEELPSHGPPMGMLPGFQYGAESLDLGPGDEVVILTGASAGLFRGAADLVASLHGKPAGEVVSMVHKAIRKARGDEPIETTVLFLRKH